MKEADVGCFHTKEGESAKLKRPLLEEMRHIRYAVVATVDREVFRANALPRYRSTLGGPYAACSMVCAMHICNWLIYGDHEGKAAFVFEAGHPEWDMTRTIFDGIVYGGGFEPRLRIASVTSARKDECVQLHPADFLAHSRSTESEWLPRIKRAMDVADVELSIDDIIDMSHRIDESVRRGKAVRKAAKKAAGLLS